MSWLDKLKEYAPSIAMTLATGGTAALPAALIGILGKELSGNDKASPVQVEEKLQAFTRQAALDPEIARQLHKADMAFREKQLELEYKDRADARKRDIAIQSKRGRNERADWMLVMAFVGFLCCLFSLIWLFLEGSPDAGLVGIVATFGTKFLGMCDLGFAFEFGGSADGSKANRNIAAILGQKVKGQGNA
ncbi:hypothetical protein [Endozoicomonas sp. 2B-B]